MARKKDDSCSATYVKMRWFVLKLAEVIGRDHLSSLEKAMEGFDITIAQARAWRSQDNGYQLVFDKCLDRLKQNALAASTDAKATQGKMRGGNNN